MINCVVESDTKVVFKIFNIMILKHDEKCNYSEYNIMWFNDDGLTKNILKTLCETKNKSCSFSKREKL